MRLTSTGLGIGTSSPSTKLVASGTTTALDSNGQILATVTDAVAADKGGQIMMGGYYTGTTPTAFAGIAGKKENGTSGSFSGYLQFLTSTGGSGNTEKARIDSSGNLLVGATSTSVGRLYVGAVTGGAYTSFGGDHVFYSCTGGPPNAAASGYALYRVNATGRSINAGGTVNASGTDYAEYMEKSGDFTIAKGDVCGIDANGKLTNVFANAISFMVKSTDPSYVGGDSWGVGFDNDAEGLEAARQTVDRIAFAGQVPVNVLGATAGQYIVPTNDNGAIKGQAVSNPTFEQYQSAVGKVIAIEADGRARIIVKVV
jgi:hypothetical protein